MICASKKENTRAVFIIQERTGQQVTFVWFYHVTHPKWMAPRCKACTKNTTWMIVYYTLTFHALPITLQRKTLMSYLYHFTGCIIVVHDWMKTLWRNLYFTFIKRLLTMMWQAKDYLSRSCSGGTSTWILRGQMGGQKKIRGGKGKKCARSAPQNVHLLS